MTLLNPIVPWSVGLFRFYPVNNDIQQWKTSLGGFPTFCMGVLLIPHRTECIVSSKKKFGRIQIETCLPSSYMVTRFKHPCAGKKRKKEKNNFVALATRGVVYGKKEKTPAPPRGLTRERCPQANGSSRSEYVRSVKSTFFPKKSKQEKTKNKHERDWSSKGELNLLPLLLTFLFTGNFCCHGTQDWKAIGGGTGYSPL